MHAVLVFCAPTDGTLSRWGEQAPFSTDPLPASKQPAAIVALRCAGS